MTDVVNTLAANLSEQVRAIAMVTKSISRGDLSQKIQVEAKGEVQELAITINDMTDQLRSFAEEVSRVALDVSLNSFVFLFIFFIFFVHILT